MNECTVLTCKEKLVIALKLIDLYSKKYQNNDFSSEILESLSICNYTPGNPHICQVKANPSVEKDHDQTESEQQMVWNLIFIMDSLLTQTATKDRDIGALDSEQTLLEAIEFFLENREENTI
jgi:hypothetical protein